MRRLGLVIAGAGVVAAAMAGVAQGRLAFLDKFEHPAVAYYSTPSTDDVSILNQRLQDGSVRLGFERNGGYLKSVLEALKVPVDSQVLVFSQGSLQGPRIGPDNPRAIYFNDRVTVGWVREGLLEVAAQDARQGLHFYTLEQRPDGAPRFASSRECLRCHVSWDTFGVPGLFVLSTIRTTASEYVNGGVTDHRSPFGERWGGWYVTGSPGSAHHMGNVVKPVRPDAPAPRVLLSTLDGRIDTGAYLSPHSDLVALMVLEHQTRAMNLITYIGWEARVAEHRQSAGGGSVREVPARVRSAAEEVVDYLLFVDEAPLAGPVKGSSGFAARFAAMGPVDGQGRSLRRLDLQRRLFTYPCSYMIYSEAFDALPGLAKRAIYERLWERLSGAAPVEPSGRLTPADRAAVVDILRATKSDLPDYFRVAAR